MFALLYNFVYPADINCLDCFHLISLLYTYYYFHSKYLKDLSNSGIFSKY